MAGNPLDWGNSPVLVGLIRGIIGAIIAGAIAYVGAQISGTPEHMARLLGYAAALAPLGALFSLGLYDQGRANNGVVQAGDVPISALAQVKNESSQRVADATEQRIEDAKPKR